MSRNAAGAGKRELQTNIDSSNELFSKSSKAAIRATTFTGSALATNNCDAVTAGIQSLVELSAHDVHLMRIMGGSTFVIPTS